MMCLLLFTCDTKRPLILKTLMTQESVGICCICATTMLTDDKHHMVSTPCGHLFGESCILDWLSNKTVCPICQSPTRPEEIHLVFWRDIFPKDQVNVISGLVSEQESQKQLINSLELDLHNKQNEIHALKEEIENLSQTHDPYKFKLKSPAIVHERKITDGFRMRASQQILSVSIKKEKKYGIQISNFDNLQNNAYIDIHDLQIRDIVPSKTSFAHYATVSSDSSLAILDYESQQIVSKTTLGTPLWSCAWTRRNLIVASGLKGTIFLYDIRTPSYQTFSLNTGPPAFSVVDITDDCLFVMTSVQTKYFDLRNNAFEDRNTNCSSGQVMSSDSSSHLILSRDTNEASAIFCVSKRNEIKPKKTRKIPFFHQISRPAISHVKNKRYVAIPDEQNNDFRLYIAEKMEKDLWEKHKNNFLITKHPSPILDLGIVSDPEFLIFTLSSSLLRVYSYPM